MIFTIIVFVLSFNSLDRSLTMLNIRVIQTLYACFATEQICKVVLQKTKKYLDIFIH